VVFLVDKNSALRSAAQARSGRYARRLPVAESAYSGLLAVPLEGEAGQGWERLEIRFFIPCGKKSERFSVYARRRCPLVVDGVGRVARRFSWRSTGRVGIERFV
jgi:hypothetical protein